MRLSPVARLPAATARPSPQGAPGAGGAGGCGSQSASPSTALRTGRGSSQRAPSPLAIQRPATEGSAESSSQGRARRAAPRSRMDMSALMSSPCRSLSSIFTSPLAPMPSSTASGLHSTPRTTRASAARAALRAAASAL